MYFLKNINCEPKMFACLHLKWLSDLLKGDFEMALGWIHTCIKGLFITWQNRTMAVQQCTCNIT